MLTNDILKLFNAFRTQLHFTADELLPEYRNPKIVSRLEQRIDGPSPLDQSTRREDIGSNNWVVSGKLTMSGFPIVVGDPHRAQDTPNLRYWVHLNAPGWDVIGATWYGFTTLWVNRLGVPLDRLGVEPTRIGRSLRDVLEFF